jgi:hypothetical protein
MIPLKNPACRWVQGALVLRAVNRIFNGLC